MKNQKINEILIYTNPYIGFRKRLNVDDESGGQVWRCIIPSSEWMTAAPFERFLVYSTCCKIDICYELLTGDSYANSRPYIGCISALFSYA